MSSGKSGSDHRGWLLVAARVAEVAIYILAAIAFLVVFTGCQATEALVKAPEEWWITTEEILLALGRDLWSVISLFLPLA